MTLEKICRKFSGSKEFTSFPADHAKTGSRHIEGIAPSSFPFIIGTMFAASKGSILVVTKNPAAMHDLMNDLTAFVDESKIAPFPSWEMLPYEFVSPAEAIERDRITTLYKLATGEHCVAVCTIESLLRAVPPRSFLKKKEIVLTPGDECPFDDIVTALSEYGYAREQRVEGYGQFAVKGGIIDIFLPSHENPVRLDFFGDTVESIREFDGETQTSIGTINEIRILPRKELVLSQQETKDLIAKITALAEKKDTLPERLRELIENDDLQAGTDIPGIEELFPLVVHPESIASYLPDGTSVVIAEYTEVMAEKETVLGLYNELYERKKGSSLCLPPDTLLKTAEAEKMIGSAARLQVFVTTPESHQWPMKSVIGFHGKIPAVREEIAKRLSDGWDV